MSFFKKTRSWYGRFERPISSLSLIAGFVFDALTLKRVDTLWENLWILGHLIIVGVFIVLINAKDNEEGDERDPSKAHFWFVNILQFFFGGILSTYLVFYFRSANIWTTWPFIIILASAFFANESFKRHYIRLSFQVSLFFLSLYSFAIFLIPVILHNIGMWIFVLSGVVSLLIIVIFINFLFKLNKNNNIESKRKITFLVFGIFVLVNFLYFTNMIPPIPLSLKDADVYHSIKKDFGGNYTVTHEKRGITRYLRLYSDFNKKSDEPVYVYSAIFSPKNLNLTIIHEWQHLDMQTKKWSTESVVSLRVVGGRDDGFRTYSMRTKTEDGKWRVNIKTKQGQTIGRLYFNIISADEIPFLETETKT